MTGIDALDPRFPIALTSEAPLFWSSLRPWWSHSSKFAMAECERAGKQAARREEAFIRAVPPLPEDLPAVEFAPRPRVYRELEPDTLAAEAPVMHYTDEEPDQPACDADVAADAPLVMWGTLNPDNVTCPACAAIIAGEPLEPLPEMTP